LPSGGRGSQVISMQPASLIVMLMPGCQAQPSTQSTHVPSSLTLRLTHAHEPSVIASPLPPSTWLRRTWARSVPPPSWMPPSAVRVYVTWPAASIAPGVATSSTRASTRLSRMATSSANDRIVGHRPRSGALDDLAQGPGQELAAADRHVDAADRGDRAASQDLDAQVLQPDPGQPALEAGPRRVGQRADVRALRGVEQHDPERLAGVDQQVADDQIVAADDQQRPGQPSLEPPPRARRSLRS
jgi:hypothetical protein